MYNSNVTSVVLLVYEDLLNLGSDNIELVQDYNMLVINLTTDTNIYLFMLLMANYILQQSFPKC